MNYPSLAGLFWANKYIALVLFAVLSFAYGALTDRPTVGGIPPTVLVDSPKPPPIYELDAFGLHFEYGKPRLAPYPVCFRDYCPVWLGQAYWSIDLLTYLFTPIILLLTTLFIIYEGIIPVWIYWKFAKS